MAGGDPDAQDSSAAGRDWSPIHEANERVVEPDMVVALVGDPNKQDGTGRTPLHDAAVNGELNWLNALIKAGADPNVRDQDGMVPLHHAESWPQCVAALLAAGADPSIRDKDGNRPAC